ncbi:valyl-tRNA synthetase [Cognatiyoonia sediminum]|uniref:Valine--tRNA ligase n=1 Tax=Cognatiyoonia sediminum TaxID=1508389 RepID=A0A1M5L1X2_9RHOB|nr:valine--tRNA ligase [Cognatiyoonia sediminum]SHG58423.1 valyl-tRNA synthetase [Cognatiyoonia sediminum]
MAMDKTFDAQSAEPRLYEAWEKAGCFRAGANAKPEASTFCIMIPPPNVTGVLHVGHAFNNTLQDLLIRWHRMRGFDTLWQPGQDHAGIATQLVVERKLKEDSNMRRTDMSREDFLAKVWDWKAESGGTIINQLKRLGASCDWERNAFTMSGAPNAPKGEDGNFHDAVLKVFVDMYNKGLIYRGKRLVNWDPHFETAISDLEVENIEVDGHMWHFKYPLAGGTTYTYIEKDEDGNVTLEEERDYISIATTRPETMLGDGAVAVHPKDERYAPIVGKLCEIPVGPKQQRRLIPIITDEYPDPDFGSGAVKITGAHDFNDYQVAKRGNIPMYSLMDTKGAMRADGRPYGEEAATAQAIANGDEDFDEAKIAAMNLVPEEYRGLDRFEARKRVVADITAEGLAVMHDVTRVEKNEDGEKVEVAETVPMVENKKIMQPFGDRSKVVIEPMLTDQWFVDAEKVVGPALDAVREGRTKIMPESGEKVYFHWLDNIEPWCISRQLWWGHQIPVWYLPSISKSATSNSIDDAELDFGNPVGFCASNEAEAMVLIEDHLSKLGVTYEFRHGGYTDVKSLEAEFRSNGGLPVWRDPDVLDTWFSSGLWPFGTLGWPEQSEELKKYFPTDVLITGQDILFFWVARMMMMSNAVMETDPFHTVYLHQLVRDEKGEKMSKTRGNVIDPLEIVDEYGADAMRFTLTQMAAMGGVLKLSEDRIKGYRNFGTKLWNAFSFAEHYEIPYPGDAPRPDAQLTLNKWIIGETAKVREAVDAALTAYHFNDAANALYAFVWGKVCDWYLEFSKPILQGDDEAAKVETQKTLRWVLDQSLILLHPIMPFITEELWGFADSRAKMLVHADWPEYGAELVDADADREMNWVISLIEGIRSARAQMNVPAGLKIPVLQTSADDHAVQALANNEALVKRLARMESITVAEEAPKGSLTVPAAGASFALPLADIIDVDAEKARLGKQLEKLNKELGGLRGRLNNPKFVESAPEAVVAEAQANLALREEEEAKLVAAIGRLEEIG